MSDKSDKPFFPEPISDTEYQRKQQQLSMNKRQSDIEGGIRNMENKIASMPPDGIDPIDMMDVLEDVIGRCGGERKLAFLDVSHDFVKAASRVPLTALLFPFLPESDKNPRFHTTVTKILMRAKFVTGVRSLPSGDNTVIVVTFK